VDSVTTPTVREILWLEIAIGNPKTEATHHDTAKMWQFDTNLGQPGSNQLPGEIEAGPLVM
jgi:hypothetical protein